MANQDLGGTRAWHWIQGCTVNRLNSRGNGCGASILLALYAEGGRGAAVDTALLSVRPVGENSMFGNFRAVRDGRRSCCLGRWMLLNSADSLFHSCPVVCPRFFFALIPINSLGANPHVFLDLVVVEVDKVLVEDDPFKGDPAAAGTRGGAARG